ncbi:GNAT family N-acetyltransferase [Paenibacillus montanisoli]|uniref:N-acetyltransferase domain-containing protein n=1 Tax=Paenibacillus montanisoli TaxID=2081970 RepID=A0A328U7D0_9BACL|nr:GNAT family N-acetyltransferase [Paenibacillus montanisoli]RAP77301.1 hypothetical protein DL346_02045 [Paenibacillus montanisoli]
MELILTNDLVKRIEFSDFEVMLGRMNAIRSRCGNPYQVEIKKYGQSTALSARGLPNDFNKLWCFEPSDLPFLDQIVEFFDSRNPDFKIDLIPTSISEEMTLKLNQKGFFQEGFHTALYTTTPTLLETEMSSVKILEVRDVEVQLFSETFCKSLELPPTIAENGESFSYLQQDPSWSLYLGFIGDKPAGFSMMYIANDGVACLAMAGTIPEYRGNGLQQAMLDRRLKDAKTKGCDLIVAQCEYGTTSFRNLQRSGFRIAFTKSVWKRQILA